jgi:hypothetical protein
LKILLKEFLPKKSLSNNLLVAFLFLAPTGALVATRAQRRA